MFLYPRFYELMKYFSIRHKCDEALNNLKPILDKDFLEIANWTRQYKTFGSEKLLMFEIDYFDWVEKVEKGVLKIHEGLYTEREPFENMLCFCKIFQIVYWDNSLHTEKVTDNEWLELKKEIKSILKRHYNDKSLA